METVVVPNQPDDNADQAHDSFIQAVKEVPQRFALSLHAAQDGAEEHGEDQQTQGVYSVGCACHRHSDV